jgi:eukaryotic-like serine/threonine-protein kinase
MSLAPGARLGPYEIVAPLGAGGMGEVYRARDPRLGRDVAIKILPEALAGTVLAMGRFEREARAIAALQHPNICAIYDIGETELHRQFIVMELLDGETLQQRATHGPLDVAQIVELGTAIADALDAAHRAGIIHRDIKPGNIYMTSRGPKLLDFGLAKSTTIDAAPAASRLPTIPPEAALTDPGSTVGTVAYMSPEQVRGEALDARTDLFSFGAVLYEMATGRPPFTGSTHGAISGAILYEAPPAPRQLRVDLPDALNTLILKALEKDRDLRCQTASELRADLRRLKRELGSDPTASTVTIPAPSTVVPVTTPPSSDAQVVAALARRHAGRIAIVATTLLAVIVAAGYVLWQRAPATAPDTRVSMLDDLQITQLTSSGRAERPAISPDGKYVAYIQRDGNDVSLWIRQTATGSNVQIVPAQPGVNLHGATITPDGGFVDFVRIERAATAFELWRVPFLGGPPRRLIDDVTSPIAWSPDARQMAFVRVDIGASGTSTAVVIADADGSRQRELAVRHLPAFFANLRNSVSTGTVPARLDWSPDGRSIAVLGVNNLSSGVIRQVVVVDVGSGSEHVITLSRSAGVLGVAWLDRESLVLNQVSEDDQPAQFWRVAYPSGVVSRLTNDLSRYVGVSLTADRASLVTAQFSARSSVWIGDANGEKGDESLTIERSRGLVTWAGERLLYMTDGRIMSVDPGRGTPQELITNAAFPASSSDGRTIVFTAGSEGTSRTLWRADVDGRNRVQLESGQTSQPWITDNDRNVIFLSMRSGQQTVWTVPIDGGTPQEIVKEFASGISVSLDSRSLMYSTQGDQSRTSLVICDLPSCTNRRTVARPNGVQFKWGPDGKSIAYRDAATQANLWLQPLDGTAARQLTHFAADRTINDYAFSRDGKRLAVTRQSIGNDIVLFKGLRPLSNR